MVIIRLAQVMCYMGELDVRTKGFSLIRSSSDRFRWMSVAWCLVGMLGVRCVALRCDGVQVSRCIPRFGTALLISSFCWLSHRSSARKRGDNCKG